MLVLKRIVTSFLYLAISVALVACTTNKNEGKYLSKQDSTQISVDTLIVNGEVYLGDSSKAHYLDIAICGEIICGIYASGSADIDAKHVIDAAGKVVSPGFIDPHTHSLSELLSTKQNHNLNYLTQGVTTVINGNDGDGEPDISKLKLALLNNGIGTNTGLLIGHGKIREKVIGRVQRIATPDEIKQMSALVEQGMKAGALGLSSGLYYVPGSFANTNEVIELAKVAAKYQGIYDTHIRDESTFSIGFLAAIDEAITIADKANIHLHLAHIKALGVDVWGQSKPAVNKINEAIKRGISISADQYPWLASGTFLRSAIMPKWLMSDSKAAFHQRLKTASLMPKIIAEVNENIRRRGGAKSLVITKYHQQELVGLSLAQIAENNNQSAVQTAIDLILDGDVRVASFNMSAQDVEHFMVQPWVVTSSDGTDGHPRKYASFPQKYQIYVKDKSLLTLGEFIHRATGLTAKYLQLQNRGVLKEGYQADLIVLDKDKYQANATYQQWNNYSSGVEHVWVNGQQTILAGKYLGTLAGQISH